MIDAQWDILLLGGASGVGESRAAAGPARQAGAFVVEFDDSGSTDPAPGSVGATGRAADRFPADRRNRYARGSSQPGRVPAPSRVRSGQPPFTVTFETAPADRCHRATIRW